MQASEVIDPIQALLQSNTPIIEKKTTSNFKQHNLNFTKMVNANYGHEHESIVSSINFHPSENILLTSGLDRKVKLFELSKQSSVEQ